MVVVGGAAPAAAATAVAAAIMCWFLGPKPTCLSAVSPSAALLLPRLVDCLCQAPQFLLAAAQLLAKIWDDMPVSQVVDILQERGWDQQTGGPPVAGGVGAAGHTGEVAAALVAAGAASIHNSETARGRSATGCPCSSSDPGCSMG